MSTSRSIRGKRGRQRSPVRPPCPGPSLALGLVRRFLFRQPLSLDLLDVLECQKQLLRRQRLGLLAEAVALHGDDDVLQAIDLGIALGDDRPQDRGIIGGGDVIRFAHIVDSTIFANGLPAQSGQLAAVGATISRVPWTRRQSSPSSSACNCADVSRTTPLVIAGHWNRPSSRRLANRHTPVPSQ